MSGPVLTGRMARCICGATGPSDQAAPGYTVRPFFEFRGEGSPAAALCKCGYAEVAHGGERDQKSRFTCGGAYEPRGPQEFDGFYCGCRGWD